MVLAAPPSLQWSGLVQADATWAQDSTNQRSDATGAPLNRDAFVLRRGRLRAEGTADLTAFVLEADFNTQNGAQAGLRQVEGAFQWAGAGALEGLALRLGAGVVPMPFGHQVAGERDADRLFTERAIFADALFPGQLDVGARAEVVWVPAGGDPSQSEETPGASYRLILAVQNGEPLGERTHPGVDPNAAKDLTGRIVVAAPLNAWLYLAGGLSALTGTGFHPGTTPTKERLVWRDLNEDGLVQTSEITALPAAAGTPSSDFDRFALGADLRARVVLPVVGPLELAAEGVLATNLDRSLRPADPVLIGRDQRALGGALALTQALGPVDVGVRLDVYAPALDRSEVRAGGTVRAEERFTAWTGAAGLRVPGGGRLVVEYQHLADALGRDDAGIPQDLRNDTLRVRLQVER